MGNRPSQNDLPTRSTTNTQTFIETCVLDADHKALKEHLERNHVEQGDLDRCLLRGLQIVQSNPRELSHVAPALTILLQFGATWNCYALLDDEQTPLHIICKSPGDHHQLLDLMIKSSQQTIINKQDNYMCTALLYAVRHGNVKCLKCMIINGANVNLGSKGHCPNSTTGIPYPIMEAIGNVYTTRRNKPAIKVHVVIVDLLIDSGADLNISSVELDKSPISVAVGCYHVYLTKKLIKNGVRLDVMDCNKDYVWSKVARLANVDLLKCMFDSGFDKDSTDHNGFSLLWTVLNSAATRHKMKALTYLLRIGVNANFRSYHRSYGKVSPFEASVLRGYHKLAEMFLISGCSCGVFSLVSIHKLKNNLKPEVEKLIKEWKVQENNVTPLKQRCRSVILNQLSPRADINIKKLPLPGCLIKFLTIPELDKFCNGSEKYFYF